MIVNILFIMLNKNNYYFKRSLILLILYFDSECVMLGQCIVRSIYFIYVIKIKLQNELFVSRLS